MKPAHRELPVLGTSIGSVCSWLSSSGAAFIRCTRFMRFSQCPHPLADIADDGLPAVVDGDVLRLDRLRRR